LRLKPLYPFAAAIGAMYVLWLLLRPPGKGDQSSKARPVLLSLLILQVGFGRANVVLLTPHWLQIAHLPVDDLICFLVVLASTDLLLQPGSSIRVKAVQPWARYSHPNFDLSPNERRR
jgi:heme A synthase